MVVVDDLAEGAIVLDGPLPMLPGITAPHADNKVTKVEKSTSARHGIGLRIFPFPF